MQCPPNSFPTDITLSQFLSIQEKGVSAWCFEPDYESLQTLLVHSRTELTFLPDPGTSSCVQSNLPLPKLNEVYYWEVKLFDLPESTSVAIGLTTKPYPTFRLPGLNRYSVALHSNGDKSHNFPFTAQTYGSSMKEGDVMGVGYRPRSGTVFFTRNGRKMDDAFIGLTRWNLFPTVGADGPCTLHVNLGQSGFVFIEANVKKWGLAPSVGTLAPPPAYGSERGSVLLEAGGVIRALESVSRPSSPPSSSALRLHGHRPRPSPLGDGSATSFTIRTPIISLGDGATPSSSHALDVPPMDGTPDTSSASCSLLQEAASNNADNVNVSVRSPSISPSSPPHGAYLAPNETHNWSSTGADLVVRLHPPPDSPLNPDPPTPSQSDIHLTTISSREQISRARGTPANATTEYNLENMGLRTQRSDISQQSATGFPPPAYSPLDAFRYADGVHVDLPAEVIAAALEGVAIPDSAVGQRNLSTRGQQRRGRHQDSNVAR